MRYDLFLEASQAFLQTGLGNKNVGLGLGGTLGRLSCGKPFSIKLSGDLDCDK